MMKNELALNIYTAQEKIRLLNQELEDMYSAIEDEVHELTRSIQEQEEELEFMTVLAEEEPKDDRREALYESISEVEIVLDYYQEELNELEEICQ